METANDVERESGENTVKRDLSTQPDLELQEASSESVNSPPQNALAVVQREHDQALDDWRFLYWTSFDLKAIERAESRYIDAEIELRRVAEGMA